MSTALDNFLAKAHKGPGQPASEADLLKLESQNGTNLPDEIRRLLTLTFSPAGFVGRSYIDFFTIRDMLSVDPWVQDAVSGFVPFASNGGGEYFGFDSRTEPPPFVMLPAIVLNWDDAMLLGRDWDAFWKTLRRGELFETKYQPVRS